MTLPANLFVDTPEMEDVSLHQLGNDVESWPEDIIQKVKERLPRAQTLNLVVKFMKKDDENGVATGSVILNSNEKTAVVPVIVKDFMMFPLDVMIAGGKLLPLNQDYFDTFFQGTQTFARLEEYPTFGGLGRFEDGNLWNAIYPPGMGRYAYASAGFPICDAVSGTIDGSEMKKFLQNPANEKTAARLLNGPFKELVVKLANLQPVNMNEYRQGVENLIPRSIAMVMRDHPNRYSLLSNADSVFHPQILSGLNRNEMMAQLATLSDHAEDDMNDVDQNGEKMLELPVQKDLVHLAVPHQDRVEEATEYDHYSVKTKTGVNVEGVVVPKVIDFDQKMTDLKLFIGKTYAALQPKVFGVRQKNSRFRPKACTPKIGQTGVFMYQPDDSHALCTVPVTVTAVVGDFDACIKATTMMGAPIKLKLSGSEQLQRIARVGKGEYMLPAKMKWVALEPMIEVSSNEVDYLAKEAALKLTDRPVTLIPTGHNFYSLRGVDKYAQAMKWDSTLLRGHQATFLLRSLGCPTVKIAAAMKEASMRGKAELHGLRFPPLVSEKVAMARPLAQAMQKKTAELRANLIKEASLLQTIPDVTRTPWFEKKSSYLENSQTVDALLSLNFVSPTNVTKYVGKIAALKAAISHLASALLASRLGMKEIPEQATANAMNRLVEVVDGLERLRATQEVAAAQ